MSFVTVDTHQQKREREKARELRKSRWWQQQLQQGRCYYCEQAFPSEDLTMDHKVPIARGGLTSKANVVVACKSCNNNKKYFSSVEWVLKRED